MAEVFEKETLQIEAVEENRCKLTFAIGPERFAEGMNHAYNKTKSRFNVPGFRKGKAPKKMIEMQYGKEIFVPEAVDFVLNDAYGAALTESGIDAVSQPDIDVLSVSVEEGVVFEALVYTKPIAKIDNYRGLTYIERDPVVSDAEIDKRIENAREKNSRLVSVTDRPAQLDDIVTLDYEGFVDGTAFEGGSATNHELKLGSHAFIPGFEEQLVGAALGAELDINVTFPEVYHSAELAGRDAVFKAAVKDIRFKELPELNDDFAQDVSEFDTFEEYRGSIVSELATEMEKSAELDKENQIMEKIIAQTEVNIPPAMIEQQMDQNASDLKMRIENSGMPFNMYLQYLGQTPEAFRESGRQNAEAQVKVRLALEAIADKEELAVTDVELESEITRMSELYNMEPDRLRSIMGARELSSLALDLRVQKAVELVLEAAIPNREEAE